MDAGNAIVIRCFEGRVSKLNGSPTKRVEYPRAGNLIPDRLSIQFLYTHEEYRIFSILSIIMKIYFHFVK